MTAVAIAPPRARRRRDDITTTGVVLMVLWALAAVGIVYALLRALSAEHLAAYGGRVVAGFLLTLKLVVFSVAIGAVISIRFDVAREECHVDADCPPDDQSTQDAVVNRFIVIYD